METWEERQNNEEEYLTRLEKKREEEAFMRLKRIFQKEMEYGRMHNKLQS